mmetsp:Transcript_4229/g.6472  ORF Transcript_4229/g.6472 Transcript_4229/m.6472 type:complete len:636 (-) Transcript_4229:221-2128(-)
MGVEYGIIETILSLIVQSPPRDVALSSSPLTHVYLSRVLIDLTKLQPTLIPQSLAAAVSGLFQDFVPSLVPSARENLSSWLAFHLTNTDYQWPKSYWEHWTPYVVKGMAIVDDAEAAGQQKKKRRKRNSRGEFVTRAIRAMATYVAGPDEIVTKCLPAGSPLSDCILEAGGDGSGAGAIVDSSLSLATDSADVGDIVKDGLVSVERDLRGRIWGTNDDPDTIREYMVGDEISESLGGNMDDDDDEGSGSGGGAADKIWWRTGLVIRALLNPAAKERARFRRAVANARDRASGGMDVDENREGSAMDEGGNGGGTGDNDNVGESGVALESADVLTDICDVVGRYRPVVLATLARDVQVHEENMDLRGEVKKDEGDMLLMGEVYILRQVEGMASYSAIMLESIVNRMIRNRIVGGMAVLRWGLGERGGGGVNDGDDGSAVLPRWHALSSAAVQIGIEIALSDSGSGGDPTGSGFGAGDDIGMIIDGGGDDADGTDGASSALSRRMKKIMTYVGPIVQHTAQRVCHLLVKAHERHSDDIKYKKKLSPLQVDLVEGMKQFISSVQHHVIAAMGKEDLSIIMAPSVGTFDLGSSTISVDIECMVAKSELSGASIASACRTALEGRDIALIETLARSMEGV